MLYGFTRTPKTEEQIRHRRQRRRAEPGDRDGGRRGTHRSHRADHGRERRGKGEPAADNPPVQPPQNKQIPCRQLRRNPRGNHQRRTFRARERRVHRGHRRAQGLFRGSRRRHPVPRRDRGAPQGDPGAAAKGAPGRRIYKGRLVEGREDRRQGGGGDQRKPRLRCGHRQVPRGPVLQALRHTDKHAGAARPQQGRHLPAVPQVLLRLRREIRALQGQPQPRSHQYPDLLPLAGQHKAAEEYRADRDRAGVEARRRQLREG